MEYQLPPELEQCVAAELVFGEFQTQEELVEAAIREFLAARAKLAPGTSS